MAGEWAVRRATLDDLPAILAFGATHIPPHYTPIIGPEAARTQVEQWWTAERMGRAIDHGQVVVAVADADVRGVGERGEWCGDPVVWKLYVHPDHRSRGIGKALLDVLVADLPVGAPRVVLEHFAGNERAGAFYEREGYVHLRTDPAPDGDPAAATVWRVRDLPG